MSIDLTGSESEFQNVLKRYLLDSVSVEAIRSGRIQTDLNTALWSGLVELGLFEVFADPTNELSCQECSLLAQEFAANVTPEPASEQLLFGSFFLSLAANAGGSEWLPQERRAGIESGITPVTHAYGGGSGSLQGSLFTGQLEFVPLGSVAAGYCMVLLENSWVLVDLSSGQTTQTLIDAVDISRRYASLQCTDVSVTPVPETLAAVPRLLQQLLIAHEVSGMCKAIQQRSLDHVKSRKQFGAEIGSFQAVQHMLADMYVWLEAIDATALFAAWAFDSAPEQREFAAAAAARIALEKGLRFLERSIQVHGGIGFTWEYDIHLYLRRLMVFRALCKPDSQDDSRLLALARKL